MIRPPASVVPTGHAIPFNSTATISSDPNDFDSHELQLTAWRRAGERTSVVESVFTTTLTKFSISRSSETLSSSIFGDHQGPGGKNQDHPKEFLVPITVTSTGTRVFSTVITDTSAPRTATSSTTTSNTPDDIPSSSTNSNPITSYTPDVISGSTSTTHPIIIGSAVGGTAFIILFVLFVFFLIRRRRRRIQLNIDAIPFRETKPPAYTDLKEREHLERRLGENEQASEWRSRAESVILDPDDTPEPIAEEDANRAVRQQLAVVMQRIVALEAELKPPEYTSERGSGT
ncbi:hypothetical protein L218DRAFT_950038 [Marasmius fiardii PR-910]|nr:hypothetical protein L218DRAFT_950038 [Marasmius fiardii PR-910]